MLLECCHPAAHVLVSIEFGLLADASCLVESGLHRRCKPPIVSRESRGRTLWSTSSCWTRGWSLT